MKSNDVFELNETDSAEIKKCLSKCLRLNTHVWRRPLVFDATLIGASNCLDIPVKPMKVLANIFGESEIYFFSQNMVDGEKNSIVSLSVSFDSEFLPSEYSYLWASENLTIFGSYYNWFILFNAELSLALVVVKSSLELKTINSIITGLEACFEILPLIEVLPSIEDDINCYGTLEDVQSGLLSIGQPLKSGSAESLSKCTSK